MFTQIERINADNINNTLNKVPSLISRTFPIPAKFRGKLPADIAELSRLLTNNRGERSLSYLARPNFLSAYLYYFLPWNLYRLCLLLPQINLSLHEGDTVTDLGCGPLTFASALWIARPDLRGVSLVFNCIDRSAPALEAGKKFFTALCESAEEKSGGRENPWKINIIKEDINLKKTSAPSVTRKRKPASLVCAVNLFNEIYEKISHNNAEELRRMASNAAKFMHSEVLKDGRILTVEPGIPQSGRFISILRGELIKLNRLPASPCTHNADCPFPGGSSKTVRGRNWIDSKKRWCHFAFDSFNAPKELIAVSKAAKLPKERLVLSFLYAGASEEKKQQLDKNNKHKKNERQNVRIISGAFPLSENRFGRYGCCERGLVLVTGDRSRIDEIKPMSLTSALPFENEQRDIKSGAIMAPIKD
ncbi:MAG: small ribosomal subunit Rsm22 family protein [Treponema sp.]|nr:small ribosomal subunit Rsm22 family protein [Treponema sp.]